MSNKGTELEKPSSDEALLARPGYPGPVGYPYSFGYGYDTEAEGDGLQLHKLWRAIRKHKWLIISIPLIVSGGVTIEAFRAKPLYEAYATIEIKKESVVVVKSGDTFIEDETDRGLSAVSLNTHILMLRSRPLLQDVVIKLRLDEEPRFTDVARKKKSFVETIKGFGKGPSEQGAGHPPPSPVAGSAGTQHSIAPTAPVEADGRQLDGARLAQLLRLLDQNLTIAPIKDTRALSVSFTHTDPAIATAVTNCVAETFAQRSFQSKTAKYTSATAWLERTTRELEAKVKQAEQILANYAREHNIFGLDGKTSLTGDKLRSLHSQLLRAETDRLLKESLYEEVRAGRVSQLPESFTDSKIAQLQAQLGQLAVEVAQLDLSFGPKHPRVVEARQKMAAIQEQIDTSRRALEEKLKAEYGRAVRDEQALRTALEQAKAEAVQENQDTIQYDILKQNVDTAKGLYTEFLQKTNQANIQLAEQPSNVRVIEPAEVPTEPVVPNRYVMILVGFLISLTSCVGIAVAIEYLRKTIQNVEDVDRYVKLPAIGVVPEIERSKPRGFLPNRNGQSNGAADVKTGLDLMRTKSDAAVALEDHSVAAEAYRTISASVLLSSRGNPPKTILVTSGLPGEGKTTTVINTAISLAQFGASVLIIDCDLRNPAVPKAFGMKGGDGLSTYLTSDVEIGTLIHKLEIPNLWLLPSGPTPHNPAKLIISRRMKSMLQMLAERYDHILIDSPPLIGVTDPAILATLVDGVILVVRGGKSTREIARRARQELVNVDANVFGVVLNHIDYQDYYYYHHAHKRDGVVTQDA